MPGNVLIVSTSEKLRELISKTFKSTGCKIHSVPDVDDTVDQLKCMNLDLLITDTKLKQVNGFQLLKAFRTIDNYKTVPGLILVGANENSLKCRARAAGASGWLLKPPSNDQLQQLVSKIFPV